MNITTLSLLATAVALFAAHALAAETTPATSSGLPSTATAEVPAIDVTGSRTALRDVLSPGVVSVVYPDDVKGEHKSLPELLDQIPGVYVRRVAGTGQYTTASIRGSAPSQVNVYIDGIPVNTSSETAADLSTISMSNVERVEVYRGVTPARFSGAPMGGAINIVTKKPTGLSGSVSAGRRSYDGRQESASITTPLFGGNLLIGVDGESSEGDFRYKDYSVADNNRLVFSDGTPYRDTTTHTIGASGEEVPVNRRRMNNSFEKNNALFKWQNQNVVAKWAYMEMERYLPKGISDNPAYLQHLQDLPSADVEYRQREQQKIKQQEALVGWHDVFGSVGLGVNFTYLDKKQQFRNRDYPVNQNFLGQRWTDYNTKRFGIVGDMTWELEKGGLVEHMLELHVERYRETLYSDISGPPSEFIDKFRRDMTRLQVQNTMTIPALGNLQVTPIVRLEKLDGPVIGSSLNPVAGPSGDLGWEPTGSISVKKSWATGWQVFGNYGSYIRYPNFYEIYGNGIGIIPGGGQAMQLKPETGRNGDVGVGWAGRLNESMTGDLRLTLFERTANDAITLYRNPLMQQYINSGDTYTNGIELEGKLSFGHRADIQFASTWQQGHYTNGGWYYFGNTSTGQRFEGQTVRTLNTPLMVSHVRLNLHFLDDRLTTYVEGKYTGRNYVDVQTWEESLTTFDIGAHYKITKGWRLSAGLTDLFNRGPKQQLKTTEAPGGSSYHPYQTDNLQAWIDSGFTIPFVQSTEYAQVARNVYFPQQGRTAYVTLAYTF
ncbi:TonB-dependent receptor [Methylobacillus caricis]|uniref:TonB-dependent receptor n=1 Tax=Methylobacillus caricis TaxID=1971611 RepID=UPI001CFFADE2|nr:TonB-dependent receptor [Methylobacillus caricis]MCB5188253.1 TonB-dependent receptor [Methylobacillus caricis]